jgi:hypothetical protein
MSKYNLTDIFEQYQIGSGWTRDFDYDGMLNAGLKVNTETPIETLKKLFDDFTDVNYHREAEHLSYAIDALEDDDIFDANGRLNDFHIEIEKTMRDQGMDTSSDLAAFMASKMEEGDKKDKIARIKASVLKEARVDREVAERIEGLMNIKLKAQFLDVFEDLWLDLIEEDPFYAEDVIAHLSNEMFKQISNRQAQGDRLAGLEEDTAMSGAIADEEEAGAIGTHLAEEKDKEVEDLLSKIRKHLENKFEDRYRKFEYDLYIDSLERDIKRGEFDGVESIPMSYHEDDFVTYIDEKSELEENKALQEHFGRFMKDYQ